MPIAPEAARHPVTVTQLGRTRTDDYGWLRDAEWQKVLRDPAALDPAIRDHLMAENAYTDAILQPTKMLQDTLYDQMVARIRPDDGTVPVPDGPFAYSRRFDPGAQHPMIVRTPRGGGAETVLLDVPARAAAHGFYRLGQTTHSDDHRRFAWAEDTRGSEFYTLHHIDLDTGFAVGVPVENTNGNFVLTDSHILWAHVDDNGRADAIYRRPLGGTPADDHLVYAEPDPGFFLQLDRTASRAWIVIESANQETAELRLIDARDPTAPPRIVAAREPGIRYDLDHDGTRFVIRTNADGATDWKIVTAPEATPGRDCWQDLVPHRPGRYIVGFVLTKYHLVHAERVDATDHLVATSHATGRQQPIDTDEPLACLNAVRGLEFDTTTLRYTTDSLRTPARTFDLDLETGERTLRKTQQIPSGHDPAAYVMQRLHAIAPDGATVPLTLFARREAFESGPCPTLLYGYGSYGHSVMPHFSVQALNLVDRGWIHAIAHVRGGSEKGWSWFLDGRGPHKQNTFTDFIACAEHLVAKGHATPGRIVAQGASAGGLLVGAVLNMRPDLWAGIAANVPFVDVLNTMSDPTLPLTPPEWPEWGNPLQDPQAYDRIAAYSPYDQVAARPYPPVLAMGGLADPRVTYWEPAKWAARLRANSTSDAPILLRINMRAGHGGRSGRYEHLREPALVQAFALWAMDRAGP